MVEPTNDTIAVRIGDAKRIRSPAYRHVYSNYAVGNIGSFDLTVTFARTHAEDGQLVHEEEVIVTMAPAQFKLFAQLCTALVAGFEKTQTPIVVPPGAGNPNIADPDKLVASLEAAKSKLASVTGGSSPTEPPQRGGRSRGARTKKAH